tara:strand:+ start:16837 stop:17232 length:396 start_codon:yes stop_codon:yes gene_type:complete
MATQGITGKQIKADTVEGVDVNEATLRAPIVLITATGTTNISADTHHTVIANISNGNSATIGLPSVSSCQGKVFTIKRIGPGSVTVSAAGEDNIDMDDAWSLPDIGESVTIQSDGVSNWWVLNAYLPPPGP